MPFGNCGGVATSKQPLSVATKATSGEQTVPLRSLVHLMVTSKICGSIG
jgi:hypothetical protein